MSRVRRKLRDWLSAVLRALAALKSGLLALLSFVITKITFIIGKAEYLLFIVGPLLLLVLMYRSLQGFWLWISYNPWNVNRHFYYDYDPLAMLRQGLLYLVLSIVLALCIWARWAIRQKD